MKRINLKVLYPEIYTEDKLLDVPEEVYFVCLDAKRKDEAHRIRTYRHKAYYSLDYGDDVERMALFTGTSPYDLYEQKLETAQLYAAIASLPDKQAERVYAHFFLGISKAAIARAEGVDERAVRIGIARGLRNLKEYLEKHF